jgi:hypothetical protein
VREVIAYALLIFGAPVAIGGLIGMIFIALPNSISKTLDGALSTLVAIGMFMLIGAKVTLFVPLFVAIVSAVWLAKRNEAKSIPWQILGVIIVAVAHTMMTSQP